MKVYIVNAKPNAWKKDLFKGKMEEKQNAIKEKQIEFGRNEEKWKKTQRRK